MYVTSVSYIHTLFQHIELYSCVVALHFNFFGKSAALKLSQQSSGESKTAIECRKEQIKLYICIVNIRSTIAYIPIYILTYRHPYIYLFNENCQLISENINARIYENCEIESCSIYFIPKHMHTYLCNYHKRI